MSKLELMGDVTENRFNGLMAEKKPDRGHLRSHHEGKKWPSRAAPGSPGYDGKGEAEAVSTPSILNYGLSASDFLDSLAR